MENKKVAIIGAGPAGCYTAYLFARQGFKVSIFEEHNCIGEPVQCTGLVSGNILNIIDIPKEIIVNKINEANLHFPSSRTNILFQLSKTDLLLNRASFDKYLLQKAIKAGAKLYLNARFINYDGKFLFIKTSKKIKKLKTNFLIGADGVFSSVAKLINKKRPKYYTGLQYLIKSKNKRNIIQFYPDIEEYAWIVPVDKFRSRMGIVSKRQNIYKEFKKFAIKNFGINYKKKIIDRIGGQIPMYNPFYRIKKDNIYLVGDAATQVKALTGGGIVFSLKKAGELVDSIIYGKKYNNIDIDLFLSLQTRKILGRYNKNTWIKFLKLFKHKKDILKNFDRDYPSKNIWNLIKNPKIFSLVKIF